VQILPEHRIPRQRSKRDALLPRLITVHELAPALIARRIQDGEVRAAARDIRHRDIDEKRAEAVAANGGGRLLCGFEPGGVMVVTLAASVLYELQGLEVRARDVEALEGEGARFDAAHDGVAGDAGGLGGTGLAVALDSRFVSDDGLSEGAFAVRVLEG
jgi:hypothetical protein